MKSFKEYKEKILSEGIAETILKQLGGNKTIVMLGMKNIAKGKDKDGNEYLGFKIGRNVSGINYIKITLNGKDLYDMEFGAIRGVNYKVKAEHKDVYFDMMKSIIEKETGMYTSL